MSDEGMIDDNERLDVCNGFGFPFETSFQFFFCHVV